MPDGTCRMMMMHALRSFSEDPLTRGKVSRFRVIWLPGRRLGVVVGLCVGWFGVVWWSVGLCGWVAGRGSTHKQVKKKKREKNIKKEKNTHTHKQETINKLKKERHEKNEIKT